MFLSLLRGITKIKKLKCFIGRHEFYHITEYEIVGDLKSITFHNHHCINCEKSELRLAACNNIKKRDYYISSYSNGSNIFDFNKFRNKER